MEQKKEVKHKVKRVYKYRDPRWQYFIVTFNGGAVDLIFAVSIEQAIFKFLKQSGGEEFDCVRDNMAALPVGKSRKGAVKRYKDFKIAARIKATTATHPKPRIGRPIQVGIQFGD